MEMEGHPANQNCIVVGVDGSLGSKSALAWAVRQSRLEGKTLVAINAWEPVTVGWTPYPSEIVDHLMVENEKVLQETLDEVLGPDRDVEVEPRLVRGPAARVLVGAADGAALLVVGRHGRHEWGGRLGSVSGYCARHARCPVVVVHH
jgi:nucleotide-binding universal stress UspA family protein